MASFEHVHNFPMDTIYTLYGIHLFYMVSMFYSECVGSLYVSYVTRMLCVLYLFGKYLMMSGDPMSPRDY